MIELLQNIPGFLNSDYADPLWYAYLFGFFVGYLAEYVHQYTRRRIAQVELTTNAELWAGLKIFGRNIVLWPYSLAHALERERLRSTLEHLAEKMEENWDADWATRDFNEAQQHSDEILRLRKHYNETHKKLEAFE